MSFQLSPAKTTGAVGSAARTARDDALSSAAYSRGSGPVLQNRGRSGSFQIS